MTISILLADDHPVVLQGLRVLLEAEADLTVVGQAADGLETLAQLKRLQPQVLLLDLMLPRLNGLEVARRAVRRAPRTKVIILSMHADESYVLRALQSGALGYVLKDSPANEIIAAVRTTVEGQRYLSPSLSLDGLDAYLAELEPADKRKRPRTPSGADAPGQSEASGSPPPDLYESLTVRERELFQMVAEGLTTNEVARRLDISPRTAEKHRARMMAKLNLKNQADVVREAIRRGIIKLDR